MGRSRPRPATAPVLAGGGPVLADSDVEEADIEALARAQLKPGEVILGEGVQPEEVKPRGLCLAPQLLQKLRDIDYKVPEGAKRVPWIDTLEITGQQGIPKGTSAKNGVNLESVFLKMAGDAVKEGYRRLRVMKVPCSRPSDFYAEMLRSDKQMYLVRQKASEETRRIKIVDDRRKSQAAKRFTKAARSKKLEARAQDKRQTLQDISAWRSKKKSDQNNEDDRALDDILDQQKGRKKGIPEKSKKRLAFDAKFGFGGKKRRKKSNDRSSTADFSRSPWGQKGEGKGKGKGFGKGGRPNGGSDGKRGAFGQPGASRKKRRKS